MYSVKDVEDVPSSAAGKIVKMYPQAAKTAQMQHVGPKAKVVFVGFGLRDGPTLNQQAQLTNPRLLLSPQGQLDMDITTKTSRNKFSRQETPNRVGGMEDHVS